MPDGQVVEVRSPRGARSAHRHGDSIERRINVWLGHRVRTLRLERGLSLVELAERVGVRYQQIAKYEHAIDRIAFGRLVVIASALSVPMSKMLDGLPGMLGDEVETDSVVTDAERALLLRSYGDIESQEVRTKLRELMRSLSGTKRRKGGGRRQVSPADLGEDLASLETAAG
mgnify:CR=1 FL=1